jgi:hypothetical protein
LARMSKEARRQARVARREARAKRRMADIAVAGTNYVGAGWVGEKMATDLAEGEDATIEVADRELPKYEVYGGVAAAAVILAGRRLSPLVAGVVLGAATGVASGAHAVRRYNAKIAGE